MMNRFLVICGKDLKVSGREGIFILILLWSPIAAAIARWVIHLTGGDFAVMGPRLLPMWLTFAMIFIGVMLLAGLFIHEKENNTWPALRLTPISLWELISAKMLVGLILSVVSVALLILLNVGLDNIFPLLVITLFGSLFTLPFGLLISHFGKTMMQFMITTRLFMIPLMLPAIFYLIPGMEAGWVRFIPTYFIMRATERVAVEGASLVDIAGYMGILTAVSIALFFVNLKIIASREHR
ncbi:ABC transporter permease [Candidatus Bipolaricaulota bacterium]|nr:ABC transporter permease [Candidatus Bipolaricaulota bacterium]